jgi:predicted ATPase
MIVRAIGARETGGLSAMEAAVEFLRDRELLLVLDNFEHVLDAAPAVGDLVARAPNVKAICSTRAALRLSGEREYAVPELSPDDAVVLFAERASAIDRDFQLNGDTPVVAEICRRLDGLPLAIELAAARTKVLSPQALLDRLDRRLSVLTGGARDLPDRQRALRDTIAWSYELLHGDEQRAFVSLAVFAGGFTLDAAERVCGADLDALASLVEKSLVRRRGDRFQMLETIREYGLEQLAERGELEGARGRHAAFFVELVEFDGEAAGEPWIEQVEVEHNNLRAALVWARESDEPRLALRLAASLAPFWELRGYFAEGRARLSETLANDPDAPIVLKKEALTKGVLLAFKQGDLATARAWAEELVAVAEQSGDESTLARGWSTLGIVLDGEGRFAEARSAARKSLAISERAGDQNMIQVSLHNLGIVSIGEGAYERAVEELTAALELSRSLGDDIDAANDQTDRGFAFIRLGRWREARADLLEALAVASRVGWRENVVVCFVALAAAAVAENQVESAARFLGHAEHLARDVQLDVADYVERVRVDVHRDLQARLPGGRLDALLAEGAGWSLEDAVAAAVAENGP